MTEEAHPGGGGGDNQEEIEVKDDKWEFEKKATITADGKAVSSQSWLNPDYGLKFTLQESVKITTGEWGILGKGSFTYQGNTYDISLETSKFSITGLSAQGNFDYGNGISLSVGINYDAGNNTYSGNVGLNVRTP